MMNFGYYVINKKTIEKRNISRYSFMSFDPISAQYPPISVSCLGALHFTVYFCLFFIYTYRFIQLLCDEIKYHIFVNKGSFSLKSAKVCRQAQRLLQREKLKFTI